MKKNTGKAPKQGEESIKEAPKTQPEVQAQPKPEKPKSLYEQISVDPNDFYDRYNKFLEDDKENKKKQVNVTGERGEKLFSMEILKAFFGNIITSLTNPKQFTLQAEYLKTYLENTGLKMAFRVIAAEAISQNKRPDEVLSFAVDRLKELGKEIEKAAGSSSGHNNSSKEPASSSKPVSQVMIFCLIKV